MKILLIDPIGAMLDFAMRCDAQGHEVRWWLPKQKDGSRNPIGDGLAQKIPDWRPAMAWADLIVLSDNARLMRELEPYRRAGFPIWGANSATAAWELDRACGVQVLESVGIECIPSLSFTSYDKALAHLTANPARYVCKPNGDVDKALSYVSKGPADLAFMLQHWKRTQPAGREFLLQQFTPGIEMAVGGWVGRDGFLSQFLENFEFKKLMPGDAGPNTGEMGTAMRYVTAEQSKLAREMLLPLEPELIRQGYTGYIDVAVIIDEKGQPWPLEFTTRPGWPLFQIQQVLHKDCAEWMLDALSGVDSFEPLEQIAVGVVLAIPDFPYGKLPRSEVSGFPIWGMDLHNRFFLHPSELKLGSAPVERSGKLVTEPIMVSAGNYLLTVSGRGDSVERARDMAYRHLKQLDVPNSPIYRIDIGCRLEEQLKELQALGYAEAWCWEEGEGEGEGEGE